MNEFPLTLEQALAWLTQNASIAVAVGSSLLALLLLFIDSRLPQDDPQSADVGDVATDVPAPIEVTPELAPEPELVPEPEPKLAPEPEPKLASESESEPTLAPAPAPAPAPALGPR